MCVWDSQEGLLCLKLDCVVGFLPSGAIPVACWSWFMLMLKLFISSIILRGLFMGFATGLIAIQRTWTTWKGHSSRVRELHVYFPSPFAGIAAFLSHRNCLLMLEVWAKAQNGVFPCHCPDQINSGWWKWCRDEYGLELTQKFDLLLVG